MLVLLSIILTASVLFPDITGTQIELVLIVGCGLALLVGLFLLVQTRRTARRKVTVPVEWEDRRSWRMPAMNMLAKPAMSTPRKIGLIVLRGYLFIAFALVVVKIVQTALG